MDLYDEFGNYVGPELEDSDYEEEEEDNQDDQNYDEENDREVALRNGDEGAMEFDPNENKIVLHEDKKYYPSSEEVYPGVKTVTLDEDAQELSEPIIKPIKQKNFSVLQKEAPELTHTAEFLESLMETPTLIRHVALIGHLHHGKTSLCDTLVQATHTQAWDPSKEVRYTDTRKDEQERALSIKSTPVSLVLENVKEKNLLINIIDCPGHVNFSDESTAALRVSDGALIVVDAVEGVMLNTERLIKHTLDANVPLCLVINKMDRLILELKLPPQDAYFKLMHTLEDVNNIISAYSPSSKRLSPELGNVCFSSGLHGWSFSLESFAQLYCTRNPACAFSAEQLSKRLWGDWFYIESSHAISKKKPSGGGAVRTFVQYILEPLYKLYAHIIGETPQDLQPVLRMMSIKLSRKELDLDPRPLLRLCLSRFFGPPRGIVSMIQRFVPSPLDGNSSKVSSHYTGYQTSSVARDMKTCNTHSNVMANVVKLYSKPDGSGFLALTRVYSGTIRVGQKVRVLGENFSQDDDEDMATVEISAISVSTGRSYIDVNYCMAGNLVLLQGVDAPMKKTATIADVLMDDDDVYIFKSLHFNTSAVMKLAVEPFNPSELPKMVEGLRKISKSYVLAQTKVEESGEHVILGTGELYMDCIMHDLRHLFSDIEIKVADPVVSFCETVVESSSLNCVAETPNKKNTLTMLAEPLDKGLAWDIENHAVDINWDKKQISDFFRNKYDWDLLSARSIWAFGADNDGPNMLLDNTLPSEVDRSALNAIRESTIQGFKWGCREGPLCDEPVRNVKFKILDASIASEPIHRGGGQIIPTARRTIYSSFLMAEPRIMEPVYMVEIQAPADCVQAVYPVLARRRGHVVHDAPKPGTPFYTIKAFLPAMDSFGFETDLRSYALGQVFCQQVFDHWAVVPGDPLDRNVILHPLEPSPPLALARDFMVKSRRRKGLSEDVGVSKYLDDSMLLKLAQHEAEMGSVI